MKSTLIELPPYVEKAEEKGALDFDFIDELEIEPVRRERLLKPGSIFGDYSIIGFVAAGGMGEVYAAERIMPDGKRLGPVALKIMVPSYKDDWMIAERFKREAKISRGVRSVHVPRVFEFGQTNEGNLFIVMELLNGEELFDRLCTYHQFTPMMVAKTFLQILEGVKVIHESGYVHRDLKPENIYFHQLGNGEEITKILDFGIAKIIEEKSDPMLSVVGRIYGTPEYISPEQGLNPDVDARSDLYSIGIMMYECLTGYLPFEGDSAYVIILKHQTEKPPRFPSSTDVDLAKIIFKTLRKDPDRRYQSAEEMIFALQDWIDQREVNRLGKSVRDSADFLPANSEKSTHQTGVQRHKRQIIDTENLPPMQIFSRDDVTGEMLAVLPHEYLDTPQKNDFHKTNTPTRKPSKTIVKAPSKKTWLNGPSIITAIALLAIIIGLAYSLFVR